ncbi:MAG: hypothetical protein QXN05_03530 [Acidilobaceae archaeon]
MASLLIGIYGFGSIGRLIAKEAVYRGFEIVGIVDIDPAIVGKTAGELLGVKDVSVKVSNDISTLRGAEVIIHATGSYLDKVYDQLAASLKLGADVISTCETLAYPWFRYPVLARKLDEIAVKNGVAILGTGINPGFLLDALVVTLSASVSGVKKVVAKRSVDAASRREPFRKKIGVGLTLEEALTGLRSGTLTGHVGYAESAMLIADALGVQPSRVVESQEPVIAETYVESKGIRVEAGKVKGVRGSGIAYRADGEEMVRVEFEAYVGASDYEEITIEGREHKVVWKSSGTPGDAGTATVVLSIAEKLRSYGPGLLTIIDLLPFRPR